MLATQLGKGLFTERLNSLCMNCLADDVYSVRRVATANLEKLSAQFGAEWTVDNILPRIEEMSQHKNFSQRMTSLYAIQALLKSLSRDSILDRVIPLVVRMAHDPVPNVRFTVAKTLAAALASVSGAPSKALSLENEVLRTLGSLGTDNDKDVRFYAAKVSQTTNCV
jgi:serine/threonine-protein phosphatase 2A regulatory subunit A